MFPTLLQVADHKGGYAPVAAAEIEEAVLSDELRKLPVSCKMTVSAGIFVGRSHCRMGRRCLLKMRQRILPELRKGDGGISFDGCLERKEQPFERGGIPGNLFPEVIAITFATIGYQHIPQRIMVRNIVPVGAVTQFHPGVVLVAGPEAAVAIEEKRETSSPLVAYQCLLVYGVAFKEPVGDRETIGQGLPALSKKVKKAFGKAYAKIIILLYVTVFVYGQHFLPGKAAHLEAVLLRSELKFAAERSQLYIAI